MDVEERRSCLERKHEEIDALAKQLGKPLSEEELAAAMQEMDEDGNGTRRVRVLCTVSDASS